MAERLKAAVLKTAVLARVPGVRIPLPPPVTLHPRFQLVCRVLSKSATGERCSVFSKNCLVRCDGCARAGAFGLLSWLRHDAGWPASDLNRRRQCGGRPCIRGFRIRVTDILELLGSGASIEEILSDYAFLSERISSPPSTMPPARLITRFCWRREIPHR
jgi:hypothetical protein